MKQTEAIPAFLTILFMVTTYSIANGIMYGALSWILLKIFTKKGKEISYTMVVIAHSACTQAYSGLMPWSDHIPRAGICRLFFRILPPCLLPVTIGIFLRYGEYTDTGYMWRDCL